ncbi:MAG: hypothetical protein RSG54_10435 [Clostridium sp.]
MDLSNVEAIIRTKNDCSDVLGAIEYKLKKANAVLNYLTDEYLEEAPSEKTRENWLFESQTIQTFIEICGDYVYEALNTAKTAQQQLEEETDKMRKGGGLEDG